MIVVRRRSRAVVAAGVVLMAAAAAVAGALTPATAAVGVSTTATAAAAVALPKPTSDLSVVVPAEAAPVANKPGMWSPVPGLSTAVYTASGASLAATVSAEIYTVNTVWLRVLIDGRPSAPGDVVFRLPGAEFDGTRSFTFGHQGLAAGKHIVQVEWFSMAGQPARIRDRTLSVSSEAAGDGRVAHVAAESDWLVKSTPTWENVPSLSRTINLAATSNLKITFSGQTTSGSGRFFARALVDGQPTDDVVFEDAGVVGGARSYVFVRKGVGAGSHSVAIQWLESGGSIMLSDRALTVFAAPEVSARSGLVESVVQSPPQAVTGFSFANLPNASTSFTTTAPSTDVEVTVGMEHQATGGRTFLRAVIDGQAVGQNDVEMSTNVNRVHAQTYTFVAKNVRPGSHTVGVQMAVDTGFAAFVGDRTVAVTFKRRNGTDFAQPYGGLAPRVGMIPSVAICFDPRRPSHPAPSTAYLRGIHDGSDSGINVQAWYRENTGSQFGLAQPTFIGCDDGRWLAPPAGRTGDWYWDTRNFALMLSDALRAADPFFNFKSYDLNGDRSLTGDELVVEIIRPQNQADGFKRQATATLDGVSMNAEVLDLYLSSITDTDHRLTNVGLLAHEGAHSILAAADMYWSPPSTNSARPNLYSLMDQHFDATHFDAFHKLKSGFVTPSLVEIPGLSTQTISLAAVETKREITIVYDPARGDKEYFILENRWAGNGNFDKALPSQGVVVWHIIEDQAIMNQFPPPFTGDRPGPLDWGRMGVRKVGVLAQSGQNVVLTYANGTPAGIRITAAEGPQELLDTTIAKI